MAPEDINAHSKLQSERVVKPQSCGKQGRWVQSCFMFGCRRNEALHLPGMKSRSPGSSTHSYLFALTNLGNRFRSGASMSKTSDLSPNGKQRETRCQPSSCLLVDNFNLRLQKPTFSNLNAKPVGTCSSNVFEKILQISPKTGNSWQNHLQNLFM